MGTSHFYDSFKLTVSKVQTVVCKAGTQWKQVVKKNDPRDKLLIPFDVKILIKKCLVSNSSALANLIVNGMIDSILFEVSDKNFQEIFNLFQSLINPEHVESLKSQLKQKNSELVELITYSIQN